VAQECFQAALGVDCEVDLAARWAVLELLGLVVRERVMTRLAELYGLLALEAEVAAAVGAGAAGLQEQLVDGFLDAVEALAEVGVGDLDIVSDLLDLNDEVVESGHVGHDSSLLSRARGAAMVILLSTRHPQDKPDLRA